MNVDTWFNWSDAEHVFDDHLDARVVDLRCELGPHQRFDLTLRIPQPHLHDLVVRIRAVEPFFVQCQQTQLIQDLCFSKLHPAMGKFDQTTVIYINQDFDREELLASIMKKSSDLSYDYYKQQVSHSEFQPPYALALTGTCAETIVHAMRRCGISIFVPSEPSPPANWVALEFDDDGVVLAHDFEVMVMSDKRDLKNGE